MTDHSPLPWTIKRYSHGMAEAVVSASNSFVCDNDDAAYPVTVADMQLIVRAVNAYQPLMNLMEEIVDSWDTDEPDGATELLMRQADALLASLKETP